MNPANGTEITPVPLGHRRDAPAEADQHAERLRLAAPVRGPETPDGVNLGDLLAAARSVSPGVLGVAAQDDTLTVFRDRPPEPAERDELAALLADGARLTRLARPRPAAVTAADLTRVLLDDATGDQEWLRAFRRYAVTHLIPREETE